MKLLILSRYDRLGASSRLRVMQFLPYLEAAGIEFRIAPFFGDDYIERLYAGQGTRGIAARAYLGRAGEWRAARKADAIWIEKETLPWLPWAAERALLARDVPFVTDFDDATFHTYDMHRSGLVRRLLGRKIDRLMAASTLVMAGNPYLAARARDAGAPQVEIVPTVVDTERYVMGPPGRTGTFPSVGWIGSPGTWKAYMIDRLPVLARTIAENGARLKAVGGGSCDHPAVDILPWTEDTEVARIQDMDIGIMPLPDTPFARGKCGYKLIQYMACGLPVIASPVGVNTDIVEHGVNGFLANDDAEWRTALETLLSNPDLRQKMGAAGRKKVEKQYSTQVLGPRFAQMLWQVSRVRPTA